MKKSFFLIFSFCFSMALVAYKIADDIITRLGMEQQNAQYHIINNLVGRFDTGPMTEGYDGNPNSVYNQSMAFQIPRAKLLPAIISGDKTGATKELCDYVKKYVNSEEFIAAYNRQREDAMPLTDKGAGIGTLKRNVEVHQKNINNYKSDTKYVAEQQKMLDETQQRIDALLQAAKKPFPGKELWEKTYPADPAVIVKKRLQEYLQLVATVDFKAALTGNGRQQKFVNPVYEKKSLKWKAIYRAGKEVNDVATAFVKEWLAGEIISAEKVKMTAQIAAPLPATGNTPAGTAGTDEATAPQAPAAESSPAPKQKKSLFNKIKDKTGVLTGN